jgi:hypothetical protein
MTSALHRLLGAAALLASAASSPAVAEEPNRSWTDPPASHAPVDETVTYPDPQVLSPGNSSAAAGSLEAASSEGGSPSPKPTETSTVDRNAKGKNNPIAGSTSRDQGEGPAPAQPVVTAKPASGTAAPQTPPTRNATASKVKTKESKTAERRTKDATVKSATRTKAVGRNRQARSRGSIVASEAARGSLERRMVEARPGYRRLRSVEEALDAGLMVTTVRTIQLPDGRRIEIESEPDPRTRLDVVVRPF